MLHKMLAGIVVLACIAAQQADAGPNAITNEVDGSKMALVPGGEFMMGGDQELGFLDELPVHKAKVGDFYIDQNEITNEQYKKFVDKTGHRIPANAVDPNFDLWQDKAPMPEVPKQPVVNVSWEDATAYCKWAGKRLPTEAEWERACRGSDGRMFPWGNKSPKEVAAAEFSRPWNNSKSYAAAGSLAATASPYGVMDMSGSAAEWVADWYDARYYRQAPAENSAGPAAGAYRVVRGGSSFDAEFYLRCVDRDFDMVSDRTKLVGFRCARNP